PGEPCPYGPGVVRGRLVLRFGPDGVAQPESQFSGLARVDRAPAPAELPQSSGGVPHRRFQERGVVGVQGCAETRPGDEMPLHEIEEAQLQDLERLAAARELDAQVGSQALAQGPDQPADARVAREVARVVVRIPDDLERVRLEVVQRLWAERSRRL